MACSSSNTPHSLPSSDSRALDPRLTIHNPTGPGSAYYRPENNQSVAGSSTAAAAAAPSGPAPIQLLDIGTPPRPYLPAPNLSRILFANHSTAEGTSSHGIPMHDFFHPGYAERMEDGAGFPLASSYPGMENSIEVEINWPGYMRYSFEMTITSSRRHFDQVYAEHITRSSLAARTAGHFDRFVRMAQLESSVPSPVPLGTRSSEGVTTGDMILRSLDPMISPEGRVIWVPHIVVRYPLGEGNTRPITQRTRW